jgi:hypothetical protein
MTGRQSDNGEDATGDGLERRAFISSSVATGLLFGVNGVATAQEREEGDDDPERKGKTVVSTTEYSDQQVDDLVGVLTTDDFGGQVTNTEFLGEDVQLDSFSETMQEFPQDGDSHLVLSSGLAEDAPKDPQTFVSSDVDGRSIPNYSPDNYDAFDVAEIRIDFVVPDGAEGLKFDYQFASEESPTFLESNFQDFFEALLFLPDGSVRNIGLLPNGNSVTVSNAAEYSNVPEGSSGQPQPPLPEPPDIVYNAVTELLTAENALSGYQGQEARLVIRIGDASDGIYDSAVLVDNLRFAGDIENPLTPVEEALINHRDTVITSMRDAIRLEAEAEAAVYNTHGSEYAETFVNYLGYKAGEVDAAELDEDVRELLDNTTVQTNADTQDDLQAAYDFYSEMYSQAQNVGPGGRADLFEQYFLGTFSNQSNYLTYSGMTAEEALTQYENDVFPNYRSSFLTELEEGDYSNADIQDIVSFINGRTAAVEEALGQSERATDNVTTNFGDNADLLGKGFGVEVEEIESGDAETEGVVSGIVLVGAIALKKLGAAAAVAKGYTALKSAAAGAKVVSVVKGSSLATKAAGALSAPKTAAVSAAKSWFATSTPPTASLLSKNGLAAYGKWGGKEIFGGYLWEAVVGDVPQPTPTGLATWSLETVVDDIKEQREVDGGAMPDACLAYERSETSIADFSVSDVDITDAVNADLSYYYEDGWYGVETGSITIENTGSEPLTPSPQITVQAVDTAPVGKDERTQYPVVFNDAIPTIESGEQATVEFEYVIPLESWGASSYRMTAELANGGTATQEFDTGITGVDLPSANFSSGALATGESTEDTYTPASDTQTATFELTYDKADLDLHLRDDQGNHTGMNYETNEFENNIPDVVHSGNDEGRLGDEYATIKEIQSSEYDIQVVAREIATVIQGQNTTNLVTSAQNGGGIDSQFDVDETEVSEAKSGPTMSVSVQATEPGPTESTIVAQATVSEINQTGSLDNVQLEAPDLTSDQTDDTIPASNLTLSDNGFTVQGGSEQQLTIDVDVPQGIDRVTYTGELQATANNGDATDAGKVGVTIAGPSALDGFDNPPLDPDGDGVFEDLDGDGQITLQDVQLYYDEVLNKRNSAYVQDNVKYFDKNGDERISLGDLQQIFEQVSDS